MTTTIERTRPSASSQATTTTTRVRIRPIRHKTLRGYWTVTDDATGEVILERSRDPEHDACRELLARGIVGTVETYTGDRAFPSFRMSIETGARLTVTDSDKRGLRIGKWQPSPFATVDEEED